MANLFTLQDLTDAKRRTASTNGTHLVDLLRKQVGDSVCVVMHSANHTKEDIIKYKKHGAIGAIGKGSKVMFETAHTYFQQHMLLMSGKNKTLSADACEDGL